MKKLFILALILTAVCLCSVQAQSSSETLYLEMNQIIPDDDVSTLTVMVRVKVTSSEEASTLKTELANRFFAGLTYTSKLHIHRTDGPCEVQEL